jgi:hypothetical protein
MFAVFSPAAGRGIDGVAPRSGEIPLTTFSAQSSLEAPYPGKVLNLRESVARASQKVQSAFREAPHQRAANRRHARAVSVATLGSAVAAVASSLGHAEITECVSCRPSWLIALAFRAAKPISDWQWNGALARTAVLPGATLEGALSALLRRSRDASDRPPSTRCCPSSSAR